MTDRKLMQQALEGLEKWRWGSDPRGADVYIAALSERLAHCDRCGKKLGGEGDIHTCTPRINQCGETCERAKMCATCAGVLAQPEQPNDFSPDWDAMAVMVEEQQRMAKRIEEFEAQPEQKPVAYTTGHCENHKQKGGCQLHNLQCGWPDCDRKPITSPPQPEQKPVAWVNQANLNSAAIQRNRGGQGDTHTWSETPTWDHSVPLYTSTQPAQRTWVGLTDEAIWLEYQRFWPFHPAEEPTLAKDIAKFALAIEQRLKEKNNG